MKACEGSDRTIYAPSPGAHSTQELFTKSSHHTAKPEAASSTLEQN